MTPNITLIAISSALIGAGTYLFLSRSLVRALMGFLLMGNGINLIFIISSGPSGEPPIIGASEEPMVDPVPQALVLTAIVITLAMMAFVLSLSHRSWQLGRQDLVDDDTESARIHALAEEDDFSDQPTPRESAAEIAAQTELTESRHHEQSDAVGRAEPGAGEHREIPAQDVIPEPDPAAEPNPDPQTEVEQVDPILSEDSDTSSAHDMGDDGVDDVMDEGADGSVADGIADAEEPGEPGPTDEGGRR